MDISVIICTHNPRMENLRRALDAIWAQSLCSEFWELLVIDNASSEALEPQLTLPLDRCVRVVREERLGLTPARLRGIAESRGELLVFVDDDNFLQADYLRHALEISNQFPFLGAWSGQCEPEFDEAPPEWTRRYWGALALREVPKDVWSNLPRNPATMPCGAGLCVRQAVAKKYWDKHQKETIILDRMGESLVSGGDNDLAATACELGQGTGLFSRLRLTHKIPPGRLTLDYLSRLLEGIEYSSVILDEKWGLKPQASSFKSRVAQVVRAFFQSTPQRTIASAVVRGRSRAIAFLQSQHSSP